MPQEAGDGMSAKNPFGDDPPGEVAGLDPLRRIRSSITRIRGLKSQVGHDGLNPSAARTLIDEITSALEQCAVLLDRSREG